MTACDFLIHDGSSRAYTLSLAELLLPVGRMERVFMHVGGIDDLIRIHDAKFPQGMVDRNPLNQGDRIDR